MGDGTHKKETDKFQKKLGMHTGKHAHIGRKHRSIPDQHDGVPESETITLGNWTGPPLFVKGIVA